MSHFSVHTSSAARCSCEASAPSSKRLWGPSMSRILVRRAVQSAHWSAGPRAHWGRRPLCRSTRRRRQRRTQRPPSSSRPREAAPASSAEARPPRSISLGEPPETRSDLENILRSQREPDITVTSICCISACVGWMKSHFYTNTSVVALLMFVGRLDG